jgi:DNA helicase-2/ATP-dependent DNA helicase PcrA
MELGREMPTGELLYLFLKDSGWLGRMYREEPARDVAESKNIAKFFDRVKSASRSLRYDNVREFVKHLDELIEAGEDPAVAEAVPRRRASRPSASSICSSAAPRPTWRRRAPASA